MYRFSIFRLLFLALMICLTVVCSAPAVFAAQAPELLLLPQTEQAERGRSYRTDLQFRSDSAASLTAFRLKITYDPSYMTLTAVERPAGTGAAEFRSNAGTGEATAVFASEEHPVSLADGLCCTLVFAVKEDAAVGSAAVTAELDQLVDSDLQPMEETITAAASVPMARLLSGEAVLRALVPSSGSLTPSFSPDITEYTLTVPHDVKQLTFAAEAESGATYRVNRKNLGAAGTSTTFIVRVTAENKQAVTEYVITAAREPAPAGTAPEDGKVEKPFTPGTTADSTGE